MPPNEPVSVESLILANHVESVNGLLYISGGGWTVQTRRIMPNGQTPITHIGIALVVAVPWHETNRQHSLTIEIRDEDANSILASVNAQLNVGRLPNLRPGTVQYPTLGLPIEIMFPHAGGYEIVARVDSADGNERRWAFQVNDIAQGVTAA